MFVLYVVQPHDKACRPRSFGWPLDIGIVRGWGMGQGQTGAHRGLAQALTLATLSKRLHS